MKTTLMFVYNYLSTDARVQRSANVLSEIHELDVLALNDGFSSNSYHVKGININSKFNIIRYFKFVFGVVRNSFGKKYDYIYAHDLYSALPALILKLLGTGRKHIYDAHETIFPQKNIPFSKRDYFFYFFERKYIQKANLIICAQSKRGEIMKEHYSLKNLPVTIQNISVLKKSDTPISSEVRKQYKEFLLKKGKTIVYAGGLNADRELKTLINAAQKLKNDCKVLLIGGGNEALQLKQYVKEQEIDNCLFIDTIPYHNLAEILGKCDIGYVSYPMTDINNIYCASNKVFEYASVYLPMIATYNTTIKEIFDTWKIGECSDDLVDSISTVVDNLDFYRKNLNAFNNKNSWADEALKLKKTILSID